MAQCIHSHWTQNFITIRVKFSNFLNFKIFNENVTFGSCVPGNHLGPRLRKLMACLAHIALLAAQPNKPTCWGGSPATTLSAGPAGTSTMAIGPGYVRIVLFTAVAWNFYPSFCRSWLTHLPVLRFVQTNYTTLESRPNPNTHLLLPSSSSLPTVRHPPMLCPLPAAVGRRTDDPRL